MADAVRAEHAAVYAYGLVDAYAAAQRRAAVTEAATVHRARRDTATALLQADGVVPPAAEAGYAIPVMVTNATTAVTMAVEIESETAVAWRSVLERSSAQPQGTIAGVRSMAVDALTDCAVRAGVVCWLSHHPPQHFRGSHEDHPARHPHRLR